MFRENSRIRQISNVEQAVVRFISLGTYVFSSWKKTDGQVTRSSRQFLSEASIILSEKWLSCSGWVSGIESMVSSQYGLIIFDNLGSGRYVD